MLYIFYVILNLALCVCRENELYKGYQVYKIDLTTEDQQNNFHRLKSDSIDFWRKPSLKYGVVGLAMVPPSHINWFEEKLQELGVVKEVAIEDVYEYLLKSEIAEKSSHNDLVFDFNGYYRYDKILAYMRSIETLYNNSSYLEVKLVDGGKTDEDRPLVYLKLSNFTSSGSKPVVVIEAGINPREWITVPAALNVVNKVISERRLLESFDWVIIPVVNPDGYEYTHTNLRFWTKNRSARSNVGVICPGVNINRNFNIDWQKSDSSSSPCSHLYAGTEPFSEPESRFIRSIHQEYGNRIQLYISLQNTGGFIAYPWQYERAASGMFREHYLLGIQMVDAMGDDYNLDVGAVAYGDRASGTSTDYVTLNGVLYAFNVDVEARGRDGVEVPVNAIRNVVDRVWRAIAVATERFLN